MQSSEDLLHLSEKNAEENLQVKKNGAVADPIEEDKTDIDEVLGMSIITESREQT